MNPNYKEIIKTLSFSHKVESNGLFDFTLENFLENEALVLEFRS